MNPYEAPRAEPMHGVGPGGVDLDVLRAIARHQRTINLAILAQLGVYVVAVFVKDDANIVVQLVVSVGALTVAVYSIVATVRLAKVMHGTAIAVVCVILMFAPCLNLVTLFVLNQQATARLKKAGYKVGILGGNPDDVR